MKAHLLLLATTALAFNAFAQGTVNFGNASTIPGWNPVADRNVRFGEWAWGWYPLMPPGALVSSNCGGYDFSGLRATLFYGVGITDLAGMTRASGTEGCTFKPSSSATAGSWFGKTATLDTVPLGTEANLIVVVWDSRLSSDPRSSVARMGIWGASDPFSYTPPAGSTAAPSEYLMNNMESFVIPWIPEPTSVALAGLGAATLMIFRRRK